MKISIESEGRIAGDEFFSTIRKSFEVKDWMRISVNVAGEVFDLCEIGAPGEMMHRLTDLEEGGTIAVEIPDDVQCDIKEVRTKLEGTLGSFERGVARWARALERRLERKRGE